MPQVIAEPASASPGTDTFFPTEADFIDPGLFLIVEGQRLTTEAQVSLLRGTEEILGCSAYQMAGLLGMEPHHYSDVKNEKRRFGPARLGQIIKLLHLHVRGVPLNLARSIYWKEGKINWRNGNVSIANHLLERGWEIPAKEGEDNAGPTETLTQWGRQAGPQPKRKTGVRSKRGSPLHEDSDEEAPVGGPDREPTS